MQRNVEGEYKPVAWWDHLGYPSFEEEEKDDFPRTGQVVKHYRENKMDDALKAWTQIKLAKALKISESAVVEIENLDVRLGIDRRERLCQLLDIPPILLGIRTCAEIQRQVEERRAGVVSSAPSPFWWVTLGYPSFAPGKDGFFPRTGEVVKYYRGRAMDKGKPWTQGGLAKALNLETNQTIWNLENLDTDLSFERRQFLSRLFDIPPILLGIITLEEIEKIVQQKGAIIAPVPIISTPASTSRKLLIDPKEYHDQLVLYWNTNHSSTAYTSLTNLRLRIDTLYRELPHARDKKPIRELLCEYHRLVAHLFRDQQKYDDAIMHLDWALCFAQLLNSDELKALVWHQQGRTFENAGRIDKAIRAYAKARKYEKRLPSNLYGSMLLHAGLVDARAAKANKAKQKAAISLLDRVGSIVRTHLDSDDPYFLDLNLDRYHLTCSAALIAVGWNKEALGELKLVKCGPIYPRAQAYNEILEAQAQFNLGEYSEAARLAASGFVVVQQINSLINIARVESLYEQFPQDLFKSDSDVARLDYLLHYKR